MKFCSEDFAFIVLSIVSEIPAGKVVSYKQLAVLSGYAKNVRQVGKVMRNADYYGDYPCHRVIHEDGSLVSFWPEQLDLLLAEGINIENGKVDIKKYRWSFSAKDE